MTGQQTDPTARLLRARIASILLGGLGVACGAFVAACSTVPPRDWPPFDLRTVRATFRADGSPVDVPVSSPTLTVLEIEFEPTPLGERWESGRRRVVLPPGCTELQIRCTYRAYAQDGAVPTPQQVFAGAARVEDVLP